jgi:hypothetical protein
VITCPLSLTAAQNDRPGHETSRIPALLLAIWTRCHRAAPSVEIATCPPLLSAATHSTIPRADVGHVGHVGHEPHIARPRAAPQAAAGAGRATGAYVPESVVNSGLP